RDPAGRVGDDRQPRLGSGQFRGDLLGAVGRGADREHELELARVVLAEHMPHGLRQVPFLVPDRHHDGNRWVFHDAGHRTAAASVTGARCSRAWSHRPVSSSISVTRAAIWERSDLVRVTWANSGWPLSFSITAITPSCLPTRRLSRWAMSWVSTTRDPWPIRDSTVSSTPRSSDCASSTITKASCSDRPLMWVSGRTSNMSLATTSSMTSWVVT